MDLFRSLQLAQIERDRLLAFKLQFGNDKVETDVFGITGIDLVVDQFDFYPFRCLYRDRLLLRFIVLSCSIPRRK